MQEKTRKEGALATLHFFGEPFCKETWHNACTYLGLNKYVLILNFLKISDKGLNIMFES